jgi:uncharacterized membrane protein
VRSVDLRARRWLAATTIAAGLFCAAVVSIPIAEIRGSTAASWSRLAFRPACHQITDRCLELGAGPLPVCARCAGLYTGGFAGLLVTLVSGRRFRPRFRWLVAAAAPSVIDFTLGLVGLPSLANWPRFSVALLPGFIAGLMLADAVCRLVAAPADPLDRSRIT